MSINERGEFIRDRGLGDEKPSEKSEERERLRLKSEYRARIENEDSLEGIPQDIIDEVKKEDAALKQRRQEIRDQLRKKE